MKAAFQLLLAFLAISNSHQACPNGWRQSAIDQTKCYLVVVSKKIWFEANAYCSGQVQNAGLTSITSAYENAALNAIVIDTPSISGCDQLWIGANDFEQNGQFVWTDGRPFQYSNWGPAQPDLSQQCVSSQARTNGKWKTEPCGTENCFICEVYSSSSGSTPASTSTTTRTTPPTSTSTTTRITDRTTTTTNSRTMTDCYDWLNFGGVTTSGVYPIEPPGSAPFDVYCDMTTNGGGWTVFQRRMDASLSFFDKTWANYKVGFKASPTGNQWLGNDKIHLLSTKDSSVTLRIEIRGDRCQSGGEFLGICLSPQPDRNVFVFGEYRFYIDSEANQYMMHTSDILAGNMTTPGKHGFSDSDGKVFATVDQPNGDGLIVPDQLGAWWFDSGTYCALNGKYNSDSWGMYFNRKYGTLDYDIVPVSTEIKLRRN